MYVNVCVCGGGGGGGAEGVCVYMCQTLCIMTIKIMLTVCTQYLRLSIFLHSRMFWRVVSHMTNAQRQQLLYFATGSATLPASADANTRNPGQ